jgi:hypothetical protein
MNLYTKKSSTENNGTFLTINGHYNRVRILDIIPLSDPQDSSFGILLHTFT